MKPHEPSWCNVAELVAVVFAHAFFVRPLSESQSARGGLEKATRFASLLS